MSETHDLKVAISTEDGVEIAAILWPDSLATPAFEGESVNLVFIKNGFALFEHDQSPAITFSPVDYQMLFDIAAREVVLLVKHESSYRQYGVKKSGRPFL